PGYWRTARLPYLREPLDAIDDPDVSVIGIVKAARTGGTETINNAIAYTIDQNPLPIMYVQPTKEDVEDEFDGRLRYMIEDSPRLADHIRSDHWATQHRIRLDTLDIYGAWPTNPQTMVRKTIGLIIFDEVDNAEAQAGYLGNSLKLLIQRID